MATFAPNQIGQYGYNPQGGSLISQLGLIAPDKKAPAPKVLGTNTLTASRPYAAPAPQAFNFEDVLRRATEMQQSALNPVLDTIKQSMDQTRQTYGQERSRLEGRRQPLQERYQALISDIKGQGDQQVQQQTKVTNAELARRGILGSSNLAEQQIVNAVQPIQQRTQALTKDAGLQGELALSDLEGLIGGLATQESQQLGNLRGNVAQLQSSGQQQAVQNALAQLQFLENQRQFDVGRQVSPAQQAASEMQQFDMLNALFNS